MKNEPMPAQGPVDVNVRGWLPIGTAPHDGSSVLLLGQSGRHADGFWESAAYNGNGCWVWAYVKCEPTHWMPLPEAPNAK